MSLENWLLLLTSLAALVWPVIALGTYASYRRCGSVLPARQVDADPRMCPRVSAVLRVCDEHKDLETTLLSVLAQRGVNIEILVISDPSADRVREVVERVSSQDTRVRLLDEPPRKQGWLAKTNALSHGAQRASGDYIVFTEANVIHEPGCVLAAVREMQAHRLSLLSLLPLLIWQTLWENAAAPAFQLAMTNLLSGPIHDPGSQDALAIGAFIMVDTEVYRALGGHEPVKGEWLDDVMLARHFKARGLSVAFRVAPRCLSARMYTSARSLFRDNVKNCLAVFGDSLRLAIPLALTFALGGISVLAAPFVGLWLGHPTLSMLGALVYFEVWFTVVISHPYMKTDRLKLAGFAVGIPVLLGASAVAAYRAIRRGSRSFRGRPIRVAD